LVKITKVISDSSS